MAKEDFCFTYYDGFAARDMAHMDRLERGGYADIILAQRKYGHLTLNQLKETLSTDFDTCFPSISLCLLKDQEGKYYIKWLNDSLLKHSHNQAHKKTWVYFIVLKSDVEEFIKIGISNNVKKRYADYKRLGFLVTELFIKDFSNRIDAEVSEFDLHQLYSAFKYEPKISFPGCTECFTLNLTETLSNG